MLLHSQAGSWFNNRFKTALSFLYKCKRLEEERDDAMKTLNEFQQGKVISSGSVCVQKVRFMAEI